MAGTVTDEDERFFRTAYRLLKPGGYLVWGNAIPDSTWKPCFDYLESIGMKRVEVRDVTKEAVARARRGQGAHRRLRRPVHRARSGLPHPGARRRASASRPSARSRTSARNPGTRLYENMVDGTDTYKVVAFQKQ